MQVREISVSYGLTVNTGNYESERVDVGATITLSPGESEDQAVDKFMAWAKARCYQARHVIKNPLDQRHQPTPTPRSKT